MAHKNNDSDLVLGLIATVGTETEVVINCLRDHLTKFSYSTSIINVSSDILTKFDKKSTFSNEYERISHFMNLGNLVRQQSKDNKILMEGVLSLIFQHRETESNKRVAYIIKSIKHPDEVDFLRDAYGFGFHLIGITSEKSRRKNYLINRKSLNESQAIEILNRDENEKDGHGQHTRDAFQESDYFITVDSNPDKLQASVFRLIDLLFGDPFISPTFNEYAMFKAYTSSLRSADLSRQIGVVITKDNEIIAEGVNDCPKAFGGLYWTIEKDNGEYHDEECGRDYKLGYDSNKIEQQKIIDSIIANLNLENSPENCALIKKAGINDLTEYGRVVHGEMEALLMCARNGISCKGGVMYATTFPCHNCAKHIITAGIKKVVYIEPYPKSKALDFYKNEITQATDATDKVVFTPFTGVGPHRFIDLFSVKSIRWYAKIRKDKDGKKLEWKREESNLRNPITRLDFSEYEKSALKNFFEVTKIFEGENSK